MYILIVHQFGNPEAAAIAVDEAGNNLVFASAEDAENFAADEFPDPADYTVLEV